MAHGSAIFLARETDWLFPLSQQLWVRENVPRQGCLAWVVSSKADTLQTAARGCKWGKMPCIGKLSYLSQPCNWCTKRNHPPKSWPLIIRGPPRLQHQSTTATRVPTCWLAAANSCVKKFLKSEEEGVPSAPGEGVVTSVRCLSMLMEGGGIGKMHCNGRAPGGDDSSNFSEDGFWFVGQARCFRKTTALRPGVPEQGIRKCQCFTTSRFRGFWIPWLLAVVTSWGRHHFCVSGHPSAQWRTLCPFHTREHPSSAIWMLTVVV